MEKTKRITSIGGQALIEGIMMVGPKKVTAAFCDEKGNISTEDIEARWTREKHPLLGKPFIRGIFSMIDTFRLGYKALSISADKLTQGDEGEELSGLDKWLDEHLGEKMTALVMTVGSVLGVGLAILLFFFLPTVLFNLLQGVVPGDISPWRSVFEGFLRIAIFVGYILLVSLLPDMRRTFQYHGAEHKTIFCYESGERAQAGALPPPVRHQLPDPDASHRHYHRLLHPLREPLPAHHYEASLHPPYGEHRL